MGDGAAAVSSLFTIPDLLFTIYDPVPKLWAGKCPGKSVLPLLRDKVCSSPADATATTAGTAKLWLPGTPSVLLEDGRIPNPD